MNSGPDHAVKRKVFKPLKRSGYRDGKLYKSTVMNGFILEDSKKVKDKRYGTMSSEAIILPNK